MYLGSKLCLFQSQNLKCNAIELAYRQNTSLNIQPFIVMCNSVLSHLGCRKEGYFVSKYDKIPLFKKHQCF